MIESSTENISRIIYPLSGLRVKGVHKVMSNPRHLKSGTWSCISVCTGTVLCTGTM